MSDITAPVRARLLNVAMARGIDFGQVLVRFALERILHRLSESTHGDRSLLNCEGVWQTPRSTGQCLSHLTSA